MLPAGFQIRRCRPEDEAAAYQVCLTTGDGGRDGTHLYRDDPRALGNIFVGPYIHLEPELAFVLEDPQGVCGYVLGALDSRQFYRAFAEEWLAPLRRQHPEPTGDPAAWTPTQKLYHQYYHPDVVCPEPYAEYPSHLHIDLMPRAQGRGLGRELMQMLLSALTARRTPGVHLGMAPENARAERFYKKLGFYELLRTSDTLYLARRLP